MQLLFDKAARGVHGLSRGFFYISQFIILVMMLTTCYDVVMRYVFARPTDWSVELNAALLIFITFLSAAELVKGDQHIQMEALYSLLPPRKKRFIDFILLIISLALCVILIWLGTKLTITNYMSGIATSGTFSLPMWIPYLCIPVGSFLMGLEFLVRIARFAQTGSEGD